MDTPQKVNIDYFKQQDAFSHPVAFFQRLDGVIKAFHQCMLNSLEIRNPVLSFYAELKPFLNKEQIQRYSEIMKNKEQEYYAFVHLLQCCHDLGFTIPKKEGYNE